MNLPVRSFREHFLQPRRTGSIEGAQGVGEAENQACGDWVRIQVRCAGGSIQAVSVQVRGCSATIACASLAAEVLEGLAVERTGSLDLRRLAAAAGATRRDLAHAPSVVARAMQAALASAGLDCQASGE